MTSRPVRELTAVSTALTDLVADLGTATSAAEVADVGVCHLRRQTGARWAEIVQTRPPGLLTTLASADPQLTAELQRCRAAVQEPPVPGTPVLPPEIVVDDFTVTSPWPAFAQAVTAATPVRSAVFTFTTGQHPTVLPVYDDRPEFFDADRRRYVRLATPLIMMALSRWQATDSLAELRNALGTRQNIGIAIGIVSGLYGISASAALDLLRSVSSQRNQKLRDLAELIIADGDLPTD